ncbi:MAG: agmatine deiminase family protein [Phycisphaerae bacterium]|nr:agmatine deiminase family protein [Phycisphaerae bacterium]
MTDLRTGWLRVTRPGWALFLTTVLLCIAPVTALGQDDGLSRPSSAVVIPDTEGAIADVLLHYDPAWEPELAPLYRDLFLALPADVRLKIACSSGDAITSFVRTWGHLAAWGGREVFLVNVNLPISIWARDRYIARQRSGQQEVAPAFVPSTWSSYEEEKNNDCIIPSFLWRASLGPPVLRTWLHIEGGNLASNKRHVFVGANVLDDNASSYTPGDVARELRTIIGRDYVLVQDYCGGVPWCHVDMYLTPVDEETVLVASPALVRSLLSVSAPSPRATRNTDDECEPPGNTDEFQTRLDGVAGLLRRHGYKVYRLPVIADPQEEWMISYNNALMEQRDGQRIVYMPVYQLGKIDRAAADVYAGLGFEVRPVDVSRLYRHGGALRCVANVTVRRANKPLHVGHLQDLPAEAGADESRACQATYRRVAFCATTGESVAEVRR